MTGSFFNLPFVVQLIVVLAFIILAKNIWKSTGLIGYGVIILAYLVVAGVVDGLYPCTTITSPDEPFTNVISQAINTWGLIGALGTGFLVAWYHSYKQDLLCNPKPLAYELSEENVRATIKELEDWDLQPERLGSLSTKQWITLGHTYYVGKKHQPDMKMCYAFTQDTPVHGGGSGDNAYYVLLNISLRGCFGERMEVTLCYQVFGLRFFGMTAECRSLLNTTTSYIDERLKQKIETLQRVLDEHNHKLNSTPALAANKPIADRYAERASVHLQLRQYTKALNDYSKAISLYPKNAQYYAARASVHRKVGDNQQAINDYQSAIDLEPINPDSYIELADTYRSDKRQASEIIDCYTKGIEACDNSSMLYLQRANCYLKLADKFPLLNSTESTINTAGEFENHLPEAKAYYEKACCDFKMSYKLTGSLPNKDSYEQMYRAAERANIGVCDEDISDSYIKLVCNKKSDSFSFSSYF